MSEEFFLNRSLNPNQLYQLRWFEIGKLPFDLVYPDAVRLENFWRQEDLAHLPYRFLIIYQETPEDRESIIWRCFFCGFWCDVFDQRLMEEHLCSRCSIISENDRLQIRASVLEQALEQIDGILNRTN